MVGIEHPIVQASIGPWSSAELAAAACEAGALGSYGTVRKPPATVREDLARLRDATDGPFAVNHTFRPFSEEAFQIGLDAAPRVVSLATGIRAELVERAHAAGCLFMQQVNTVEQAERAAAMGVDVLIAQGSEAGGFGGHVGTLALVRQVARAVAPLPVLAAGGVCDGAGLAAALVLGAQGVNVGTRFMAAAESTVPDGYKQAILTAHSEDTVKVAFADSVFPPEDEGGFGTVPRSLRTPFVERGNADPAAVARDAERWREELTSAVAEGRGHEVAPLAGETAGMVDAIEPVGEIVDSMVREAAEALRRGAALATY
jgi:nitronate monooxygenase/enoyl-[acyl-carrier protein] reductase II